MLAHYAVPLERPADGVDLLVAGGAIDVFPVFLQLVSQADPLFGGIVERGDVGGGGRRRQVEYFLHDPLPTVDGVGNHAVRGDGEGGGLGEQSAAGMLLLEADLSETIPVHPGDFIVLRETLVDEREVAVDEVQQTEVVLEQFGKEVGRFGAHGFAQTSSHHPTGVLDHQVIELLQAQPLLHEAMVEGGCPLVPQHAKNLLLEDLWLRKIAFGCE